MTATDHLPYLFIDFEGSSLLPGTYPVEVGWEGDGIPGESHLIDPTPFLGWGQWSPESEAVHGISLQQLKREGRPADWVARRFLEVLHGRQGVVSSETFDGMWAELLLETIDAEKPVLLSNQKAMMREATRIMLAPLGPQPDEEQARQTGWYMRRKELLDIAQECIGEASESFQAIKKPHRARHDAELDYACYQKVQELCRERLRAMPEAAKASGPELR